MPSVVVDNRRKAAAVVVALGPERAAELMKNLDEHEVQTLASEVASLGSMPAEQVLRTLQELAETIVGQRLAAEGGMRYARELLQRVVGGERAELIIERIETKPFWYLAKADAQLAARALGAEPPSSVAMAMAHLDTDVAARILVNLEPMHRADVAMRIAALEHLHPEVVAEVDADFERRLSPMLEQPHEEVTGLTSLVDLLNKANRETSRELLEAIELQDPELAARIRDALFVFEDVAHLDDRAIQQLLRSVDTRDLSVAMKNAPAEITEAILRNLSERARENLVEEIEFLKSVRANDINEARTRVVRAIVALEEAGTITIDRGDDEDFA
jgi:flagellar motor switch protein FliG